MSSDHHSEKDSAQASERILVLATGNPDKVKELNELLEGKGWTVRSLPEIAGDAEIEENGATLDENAEIKARFAWEKTGLPALADDTGLEVDALGGMPGVWSARYAGPSADALKNRRKLLDELRHVTEPARRSARFRTVLVYIGPEQMVSHSESHIGGGGITPDADTDTDTDTGADADIDRPGMETITRKYEGMCEGRIITEERGGAGFGYDPLFVPEGCDETFAEMDPVEKNRISHRGRALQKFLQDMS